MLMIDIETLGHDSNSVVLSAYVVYFNPDTFPTWDELITEGQFVKFSVKDQVRNYKRTMDKDTMDWWAEQSRHCKDKSFSPKASDLLLVDGYQQLVNYLDRHDPSRKQVMWARGSMDQACLDSLGRDLGLKPLSPYYRWRDVRTALDILKTTSERGYCPIECQGFTEDMVQKHDPVHDCAHDIMQLVYGK